MSNQNALLGLMSQDDLEGIKNQIHSRIMRAREIRDSQKELTFKNSS